MPTPATRARAGSSQAVNDCSTNPSSIDGSGRDRPLLAYPPLRTVRASFPAYGLSNFSIDFFCFNIGLYCAVTYLLPIWISVFHVYLISFPFLFLSLNLHLCIQRIEQFLFCFSVSCFGNLSIPILLSLIQFSVSSVLFAVSSVHIDTLLHRQMLGLMLVMLNSSYTIPSTAGSVFL